MSESPSLSLRDSQAGGRDLHTNMQIHVTQSNRALTWHRSRKDEFPFGTPFGSEFQLFLKPKGVGFPCEHPNTSHFIAPGRCNAHPKGRPEGRTSVPAKRCSPA